MNIARPYSLLLVCMPLIWVLGLDQFIWYGLMCLLVAQVLVNGRAPVPQRGRGDYALLVLLFAVAISAIFVTVIVLATNVRFADVVVAFAPGAMDAMLALALTLHIDPIFVGAHHLSRFVFVSITTPGIVHLFGRPQEDVDD